MIIYFGFFNYLLLRPFNAYLENYFLQFDLQAGVSQKWEKSMAKALVYFH